MRLRPPLIHTSLAGATAGLLAMVLVIRLNPEVTPSLKTLLLGVPVWGSWGAFMVGVPVTAALALAARLRHSAIPGGRWPAPAYMAIAFAVAAVLSRVNADLHPEYLSGSAHRILRHDAVAWLIAALLAVLGGIAVRRLGRPTWMRVLFVLAMLSLPVGRLAVIPSPLMQPEEVSPRPLGAPRGRLLVIGVEGLDPQFLLSQTAEGRCPSLDLLQSDGTWGPLNPFRPYLPRAHWTALGTGTLPRRNGVKSRWGWHLPLLFDRTLRLLPWTPQGSRLILPWGLATRVTPPPSGVPPLWQRLHASDLSTVVLDWPGLWNRQAGIVTPESLGVESAADPSLITAIEAALEAFPEERSEVLAALAADSARVRTAEHALATGSDNVWLHLGTLGITRRRLEPLHALDTSEREIQELIVELFDRQLETLLAAATPSTLVAVVSPYGLSPPDPLERIRRLLGAGGTWRTSAETCPDGFLVLSGDGVASGHSITGADLEDLAPTLCYLLGLPAAQYMDGRIMLDVVDPAYLAQHPLRVID